MKLSYSVTYEFASKPPLTHQGVAQGRAVSVCARRALVEAQRTLKPINWSSVVFVALERLDKPRERVPSASSTRNQAGGGLTPPPKPPRRRKPPVRSGSRTS